MLVEASEIVLVAAPAPPSSRVLCARQIICIHAEISQWLTAFAEWLVPRKRRKSVFAPRAQLYFLDCLALGTYVFGNCNRHLRSLLRNVNGSWCLHSISLLNSFYYKCKLYRLNSSIVYSNNASTFATTFLVPIARLRELFEKDR